MPWLIEDAERLHQRRLRDTEILRDRVFMVADRERAMLFTTILIAFLLFLGFLLLRVGAMPAGELAALIGLATVIAVVIAYLAQSRLRRWVRARLDEFDRRDAEEFDRYLADLESIEGASP